MVKGLSKKRNESYRLITNWNFLSFFFHITLRLGKDQKYVSKRGRGGGLVVGNTGFYQIQIAGELCLDCLGRIPVKIVNQKTIIAVWM